jgi:protein TonB
MNEPRGAFGAYGRGSGAARSWIPSVLASSGIYIGIAILVVIFGSTAKKMARLAAVEVKFVEKVMAPPPPAPAPPVAEVKPQAPAAMAPVVRPDQKVRHLDKPPPPKEMVAPKTMPQQAPREADPSEDKGVAVYGDAGKGDPAGLEGGVAQGGSLGGQVGGAIALPEDAMAPVPAGSNPIPAYPQEARASGRTGMVILKIVILADGSVANVQVMRGDEPFVGAAVAAVKRWHYEPARYKGQPISVYRIIQIPFRLA